MARGSLAGLGVCLSVGLAVVSASAGARRPSTSADTVEKDAFALFFAVASGEGYEVSGVNGTHVPCGTEGLKYGCRVKEISFAPMNITAATSAAILANVGHTPGTANVIFSGQVEDGVLSVYQTWLAPAAVPTGVELYAVSHANEQSLLVNEWAPHPLGTLDFTAAPLASDCFSSPCTPSLTTVEGVVMTPVGVLLAGSPEPGGSFKVLHYFLAVSVGSTEGVGGYSYCDADQVVCANSYCVNTGAECLYPHGHGPFLRPSLVLAPTFDAWQLATGQLLPGDLPATSDGG